MTALTVDELLELHRIGIERHGGLGTIPKDAPSRLESVLYTATYQGDNLLAYSAALLSYVARAQHFSDGNKRLAWSACVRALEVNGFSLEVVADEAESFVYQVVTDRHLGIDEIADKLAEWLVELPPVNLPNASSEMTSSGGTEARGEVNAADDPGGDERA